jgi:hypothetical protein
VEDVLLAVACARLPRYRTLGLLEDMLDEEVEKLGTPEFDW